jgi:prepilin-type N-terminal cleavage/methylation domain-containing protein
VRGSRGEAGFTLLEVTVAAAILLVVFLMGLDAILAGERVAGETATRHAAWSEVAAALAVLGADLRQAGPAGSGSGTTVDASPEGGANQRITFRPKTGFDATAKQTTWAIDAVAYWYDAADAALKRQQGAGPITVVATSIDPGFAFALASGIVTVSAASTRVLPTDGTSVAASEIEEFMLTN